MNNMLLEVQCKFIVYFECGITRNIEAYRLNLLHIWDYKRGNNDI